MRIWAVQWRFPGIAGTASLVLASAGRARTRYRGFTNGIATGFDAKARAAFAVR
jgi:hypothetical protein